MKPAWISRRKMPVLYRIVLFLAWLGIKICYRHKVYHQHHTKGAGIIVANHTSFIDPPIVSISYPEEIHFLARKTLFKNPLFGGFISRLNAHPINGDGADVSVFRVVGKILEAGQKVLLFPEGKRSHNQELGSIKPGVALLALRFQANIIPSYIDGASKVWGRRHKFPRLFGKTTCIFGKPIEIASYLLMDKKLAQAAITIEIEKRILALKEWFEKGAKGRIP